MKKNIALIIAFSLMILVPLVTAQSIVPGVSIGEKFDYSYNIIWTSTNPTATLPSELVDYNNTQKIQFKITSVSGAQIGVDFIRFFKNGTQYTTAGTINVESGLTSVPFGFLIIGANLEKNQQVYPNGGYQTITDTVMRSYATGQRVTNVISGEDSSGSKTTYYDKIKGIAVEYSYEIRGVSGGYTTSSTEKMVNTNSDVWSVIPEFPVFVVPLVLVAASAVLLLAMKRTRKL